jgi:glyoxylase-like metal-dependent hydrolase (beta-lactamase superfamily II)
MSLIAPFTVLCILASAAAAPEQVAPDAFLVRGAFVPGAQPDGNSVVFRGPAGLLVVDTGRHAAHARAILDLASGWKEPIAVVVNTHWHLDHVSGNPAIRRSHPAVEVVASGAIVEARAGFLARYREQLEAMQAASEDAAGRQRLADEIGRIDAGRALEPDRVVRETATLTLAGRRVELGLAASAATAGDVWLLDRASGVLAAGDLVTLPVPLLDTACPAGWSAALARLSEVPYRVLVPGHGRPLTPAEVARWRTGFDHLLACAASTARAEACIDGWIADLGPLLPEAERPFARDLLAHYVPEILRAPPARVAPECRSRTRTESVR